MSEYPLYPTLSEEAQKEAVELIECFKEKLKKAAEGVISDLYVNVMPYIESDSWGNFRNQLLDGLSNYRNRKVQAEYDFNKIRKAIFEQFRDEIMKEMPEELKAENEQLKQELKWTRERNIY